MRFGNWDDRDRVSEVKRRRGDAVSLKETVCLDGFAKRSVGKFVGLYEDDGVRDCVER